MLHAAIDVRRRVVCSTPFGITEVGMQARQPESLADVWCSTPFGITEVGIRCTATSQCAASMVLNAFRHHRGGHRRRPAAVICSMRVLNAFRHHRGGHACLLMPSAGSHRCSTPFGITEVGMRRSTLRPRSCT